MKIPLSTFVFQNMKTNGKRINAPADLLL